MNFRLNVQPLVSRPDMAPKKSRPRAIKRSYLATYSYGTGLHRITIKADDRFAAHDLANESTPAGTVFTALREITKPGQRRKSKQ